MSGAAAVRSYRRSAGSLIMFRAFAGNPESTANSKLQNKSSLPHDNLYRLCEFRDEAGSTCIEWKCLGASSSAG